MILTSLQKKPDSFGCHKWEDGKLPVSGPAYKDLGSNHSHPHSKKKSEEIKNQQLFLGPSKNWVHRVNRTIQRGKLTDTKNHSLLSGAETTNGTSTKVEKPKL